MNYLKSMYNGLLTRQEIDSTSTAVQFIWNSDFSIDKRSWNVYSVFKEFGHIRNIEVFKMQLTLNRLFIVEFATHQEAVAVLSRRQIRIDNHKIIVEPCKRAHFPAKIDKRVRIDDILLQPPNRESPKNILNILNDDCLYEIFKRIHPSKCYIIADVCVKFNQIITDMLAKKHQKDNFYICNMEFFTITEADHYLRYFGSSIYEAGIIGFVKSANRLKFKIILRMISEYCVNVRRLTFTYLQIRKETVDEIIPLFMRIEKLKIIGSDILSLPLINCSKLVDITWWDLESYSFQENRFNSLSNFLYHNTQLTYLYYYGNTSCKNVHLPMNTSLFGLFKSLKYLRIINSKEDADLGSEELITVTELMQELAREKVPIEFLTLVRTSVDDTAIENIAQIKTMKKFIYFDNKYYLPSSCALTRDAIDSYIIRLESGLPNLEYLQFQTSFYIDIVFRDKHVKLIENDLKQITSEIKLNMQQFDGNVINDKYNLTTIHNTFRQYRSITKSSTEKVCWELKLTIRKFPVIDSSVQRYWLTLCYKDEDRHDSRLPIINELARVRVRDRKIYDGKFIYAKARA